MIVAAPVSALVAFFGTYNQALAVFYSVAFTAALISLLPGYRKRGWFQLTLGTIALLHGLGSIVFADSFEGIEAGKFFLVFILDFLACLGIFMATARMLKDPIDPFEPANIEPAPPSSTDEGAD